jgi:hypothetical protein
LPAVNYPSNNHLPSQQLSWTFAPVTSAFTGNLASVINAKYEKLPRESEDGHAPLLDARLHEIFCFEHTRTVANDFVVRHDYRFFKILKENRNKSRPKDKVTVRIYLDGGLAIYWKGKALLVKELGIQDHKDHIRIVA